jgi:hypothetical protein
MGAVDGVVKAYVPAVLAVPPLNTEEPKVCP